MSRLYAQWIASWERRIAQQDLNRRVSPFEWGLDWLETDACAANPSEWLQGYSRRAVQCSDEFFSYQRPKDFALAEHHLTFESPLASPAGGFVGAMDTEKIGLALCVLGAGRERVDSAIDPAVGLRFHKKVGDPVAAGDPLCTIYYNDDQRCAEAGRRIVEAYSFSAGPVERPVLIKKTIHGDP